MILKKGKRWLTSLLVLALSFGMGVVVPEQADAASAFRVEINKTTNQLTLYKNGVVRRTYPVATGRTPDRTPEGTFRIIVKFNKPGWKGIPGGKPNNPLGARWLGLQVNGDKGRTYGIHGTNRPESIGSHASNGCIRMYNKDVIALYNTVPTGTQVTIRRWSGQPGVKPVTGKVIITATRANIRSKPSMAGSVVAQANKGTVIPLSGKVGNWYQVKLSSGKTAYVHDSVARKADSPPTNRRLTVTAELANIREKPSMAGKVLELAPKGTVLNSTGFSGHWHRIKLKSGRTAYIHQNVVR
ncbi:L,D-transpeptidase family protein [Salinithrix halophila]|uniref:L,D-transpeptidase family protein n=1 Tax=Salinithrix halophila TaxID=1485204 RepID=A0ABV8JDW4_9BACL